MFLTCLPPPFPSSSPHSSSSFSSSQLTHIPTRVSMHYLAGVSVAVRALSDAFSLLSLPSPATLAEENVSHIDLQPVLGAVAETGPTHHHEARHICRHICLSVPFPKDEGDREWAVTQNIFLPHPFTSLLNSFPLATLVKMCREAAERKTSK